jgi:hypothetical protein
VCGNDAKRAQESGDHEVQAVAVRGTVAFHNLAGAGWGLAVTGGAGLYEAGERRGRTTEAAGAKERARARGCATMNPALEVDPGGERSRARLLHSSTKNAKSL